MRWSLVAVLALVACGQQAAHVHKGAHENHGDALTFPGLLAVEWKAGTSHEQIANEDRRLGVETEFNTPEVADEELTVVRSDNAADELISKLRSDAFVETVEPVYEYDAFFAPNDPDYSRQWHMQQIGAEIAWDWGTGTDVVVAVIDTGVSTLSDLPESEFVPGYDFVNKRAIATDDQGHGSHVAGTIAQATHNGTGVAGLAHGAKIMPLKVLNSYGAGKTTDIADAIRWAVDHGAKVLNLSLGGGAYSQIMASAVRYAQDKGAVVVCAAGNTGRSPVSYPAAYEGSVAVSAVRVDRQLAPYSSFGPEIDLAAPGGDMKVDQNKDGYPDGVLQQTIGGEFKLYQGTSMASPHVAGAAALVAGAGVTRAEAIERILYDSATSLGDANKFGAGEVDAGAALRSVRLFGGLWRFGIAVLLSLIAVRIIRRNGEKAAGLGFLGWPALLLASAGLLFVPMLGFGHTAAGALLSTPLPEWGQMIHGASSTSPLWLSALGPFIALGVSRFRPLQGISAALCFGFAAYMLHGAWVGWVDLAWIPGRMLEATWLVVNGLLAFGFGTMALRTVR